MFQLERGECGMGMGDGDGDGGDDGFYRYGGTFQILGESLVWTVVSVCKCLEINMASAMCTDELGWWMVGLFGPQSSYPPTRLCYNYESDGPLCCVDLCV